MSVARRMPQIDFTKGLAHMRREICRQGFLLRSRKARIDEGRFYDEILIDQLATKLKLVLRSLETDASPVFPVISLQMASDVNRVFMTRPGAMRDLLAVPDGSLLQLQKVLAKHGFAMVEEYVTGDEAVKVKQTIGVPLHLRDKIRPRFLTLVAGNTSGLSPIERFRCSPVGMFEEARDTGAGTETLFEDLAETAVVKSIFEAEYTNKLPCVQVLMLGLTFFKNTMDLDNLGKTLDKLLQNRKQLNLFFENRPGMARIFDMVINYAARQYLLIGQYEKAASLCRRVRSPNSGDFVRGFIAYYSLAEIATGNFPLYFDLVERMEQEYKDLQEEPFYAVVLMAARLARCLYRLPAQPELEKLVEVYPAMLEREDFKIFRPIIEDQGLLYAWVMLQVVAPDRVRAHLETVELKHQDPYLAKALEVCLLEQEGELTKAAALLENLGEELSSTGAPMASPMVEIYYQLFGEEDEHDMVHPEDVKLQHVVPSPNPKIYRALATRLKAIGKAAREAVSVASASPTAQALRPDALPGKVVDRVDLTDFIFRSAWRFYNDAFPKAAAARLEEDFLDKIQSAQELAPLLDFSKAETILSKETEITLSQSMKNMAAKLKISRITLQWQNGAINFRIYPNDAYEETSVFTGTVDENLSVNFSVPSQKLRLAGMFFESIIVDRLVDLLQ